VVVVVHILVLEVLEVLGVGALVEVLHLAP
jgi:hypothetical protein